MSSAASLPGVRVCGVLVDLGGVVYVGTTPLPGALSALDRLRRSALPVRFITNTTRQPKRAILAQLAAMGVTIAPAELLTPSQMACDWLLAHRRTPHLLVHERLEEDFADLPAGTGEAVVVGDVGPALDYDRLNTAYRKLEAGADFLALARNRNFLDADHRPSLDAGPFVAALEYATGRRATVLGKPSADFFHLAVESMGCSARETVMIGDDAEADVGGALAAGLAGILVRTGKYRGGDETKLDPPPTCVADDLGAAIDHLIP